MATIQSIIDRVTNVSKDRDRARWTLPEIAGWLNEAVQLIANLNPRSASQYRALTLAAGARQDLRTIDASVRWVRIHELLCNMNGNDPTGTTIRNVYRPALDYSLRTWRGVAPTATEVKEYCTDEREPFTFDVNPPVAAGTKVYALVSITPAPCMILNGGGTALVDPAEVFPLADGYDIPAVDYVLSRMFTKDTNDPSYATRAGAHLQSFQIAMGVETNDAAAGAK